MARRSPPLEKFFWSRVDQSSDGCWPWLGRVTGRGYGTIKIGEFGKEILAHRASWMISSHMEIPDGLQICHACDNPICVRPTHLFVGTQSQNIQDAIEKGRFKLGANLPDRSAITHCRQGHAYDEQNTGYSHNSDGSTHRYCRACHRERARIRRRSRAA